MNRNFQWKKKNTTWSFEKGTNHNNLKKLCKIMYLNKNRYILQMKRPHRASKLI